EGGGRHAAFRGFTAAALQPCVVDIGGNKVGHQGGALGVVDGDFPVHAIELGGGDKAAGFHQHYRQTVIQGRLAQLHDTFIGHDVASQQQARQRRAGERSEAAGDDDVVPDTGNHQQGAGAEQVQGIGHGAGTENDV